MHPIPSPLRRQGGSHERDRPPARTYGPPITIPSSYFLGLVAYNAWCDAHLDDPAVDWMELSEAERAMWRRIATKVAERIRDATEHSHALGNYLPPPRCRAKQRDRYTFYICCRWDPIWPKLAPMAKATVGCRSSRELAAAALARVLQPRHRKLTGAPGPRGWTHGWHQPRSGQATNSSGVLPSRT